MSLTQNAGEERQMGRVIGKTDRYPANDRLLEPHRVKESPRVNSNRSLRLEIGRNSIIGIGDWEEIKNRSRISEGRGDGRNQRFASGRITPGRESVPLEVR